MIQVRGLTYQFPNGPRLTFPDLDLLKGSKCLLIGESGSGKTTLLHLIGGLLRAQHGTIKIHDTEINTLSETALDHFRGKHLGFVFQRSHLITALSVEKNLMLARYLGGNHEDLTQTRALLERLGLQSVRHASVTRLSQGQVQRVAIARAVVNHPKIIFADEPTSSLDDKNCERVIHLLTEVADENDATLVVATHDYRLKEIIPHHINLGSVS